MDEPTKTRSRTYIVRPRGEEWLTFWRHQFRKAMGKRRRSLLSKSEEKEQLILGPGSLGRALRFIRLTGYEEITVDRLYWDRKSDDLHVVVRAARFMHVKTAVELCGVE